MANMIQMMQKASQMRQKMQELQTRMHMTEITGESGSGLVRCATNGKFELKSLKIDKSLLNPAEGSLLEDLIVAAVNDARRKAEDMMRHETQKMMEDLGLPKDFDLPV